MVAAGNQPWLEPGSMHHWHNRLPSRIDPPRFTSIVHLFSVLTFYNFCCMISYAGPGGKDIRRTRTLSAYTIQQPAQGMGQNRVPTDREMLRTPTKKGRVSWSSKAIASNVGPRGRSRTGPSERRQKVDRWPRANAQSVERPSRDFCRARKPASNTSLLPP